MASIGIIAGEFHKQWAERMVDVAKARAKELNAHVADVVWVPGSFEVPLALDRMLKRREIDAVAVLGIIEKGSTQHGEVMGHAVMAKMLELQLKYNKPVGLGIIGPGATHEQAEGRLEEHARRAVNAAVKMLDSK